MEAAAWSPHRSRRWSRTDSKAELRRQELDLLTRNPLFGKVILGRPLSIQTNQHEDSYPTFERSEFVIQCLKYHNLLRELHQAPQLRLSREMCCVAQNWANHLAHTNTLYHESQRTYGQNLFLRWSGDQDFEVTAKEVCDYWYSEITQYDYTLPPEILHVNSGHFTQMIWLDSQELGVGKARTRTGKILVVANYRPAGNVLRRFHLNVLPPVMPTEEHVDPPSPQHSVFEDDE